MRRVQHVVVIVPVDANVQKAEDVAQEHTPERLQGRERRIVRDSQLEHHNREDDGENAVAEGFQTTLPNVPPLPGRYGSGVSCFK